MIARLRAVCLFRLLALVGVVLLPLPIAGCSGDGPAVGEVSGRVSVAGDPLKEGFVNFEDATRGVGASAAVKDGAYAFDSPLEVGKYKVYVQPPSLIPSAATAAGPGGSPIPMDYLYAGSSPLEADVVAGSNQFDFDLQK